MNLSFLLRHARMAWAACLLVPVLAIAQSPYEGIYFGTYQGASDDGEFALIVDNRGQGTLAAYDAVDDRGYIEKNIPVQPDGSFRFVTLRGVHIEGYATDSGISGDYSTAGGEGSFAGWRAADAGPLQDAAGYYSGPVTITGTDIVIRSNLAAIIAADGSAFFLLDHAFQESSGFAPDEFDFDLDLGYGPGLDFDFGSSFPFGGGFDAPFPGGFGMDLPFPFGPGAGSPFPFDSGFDSPFPFRNGFDAPFPFGNGFEVPLPFGTRFDAPFPFDTGFGSPFRRDWGFDLPFPFGSGFNTSFNLGSGFGFDATFRLGAGPCGPFQPGSGIGWPFNIGLDYSFELSILGFLDLDFSVQLPTCHSAWPHPDWTWDRFPEPIAYSGGMIQIAPDGYIQGSLLDGLAMEGYLDTTTASASGFLSQRMDAILWTGDWTIERLLTTTSLRVAEHYNSLPDVNGDGNADIAWHHAVSGENALWLMEGADIIAELPLKMHWDPQWELVAVNALNEDPQPDLVWRHPVTGKIFVWLSGGLTPVHFELDPEWRIAGSGDFDADAGLEFLIWNSSTGATALLTDLTGQAALLPLAEMDDPSWFPAAVADFNGDANPDVLWANRHSPDLLIRVMNANAPAHEFHVTAETAGQHELAGIGDFDGDGSTDILWRDQLTGLAIVTLRPGRDGAEDIPLGLNMTLEWQVAAVGDLDGDGTDDLVWRHGLTGDNTAWRVVDAQVVATDPLVPVPDLHWTIQP